MIPDYDRGEYIMLKGKRHYVIHPKSRRKIKRKYRYNFMYLNPGRTEL